MSDGVIFRGHANLDFYLDVTFFFFKKYIKLTKKVNKYQTYQRQVVSGRLSWAGAAGASLHVQGGWQCPVADTGGRARPFPHTAPGTRSKTRSTLCATGLGLRGGCVATAEPWPSLGLLVPVCGTMALADQLTSGRGGSFHFQVEDGALPAAFPLPPLPPLPAPCPLSPRLLQQSPLWLPTQRQQWPQHENWTPSRPW